MRRAPLLALVGLLSLAPGCASAGDFSGDAAASDAAAPPAGPTLGDRIARYAVSPLFRAARWSLCARYLDTGEAVVDLEGGKALAIGSNMKLLTAAAALETLGPSFAYHTDLYYTGEPKGDALEGDLVVRGAGDPTLFSALVPSAVPVSRVADDIAAELRRRGISRVAGGIVADVSLFGGTLVPYDWSWGDMGSRNMTLLTALCVHDNNLECAFRAGHGGVELVSMRPELPFLRLENRLTLGRPKSAFVFRARSLPGDSSITLTGRVPADGKDHALLAAIPDPPLAMAQLLGKELAVRGIAIGRDPTVATKGQAIDAGKKLLSIDSPPLSEIVRYMLKRSVNLYAELLALSLGQRGSGAVSVGAGARAIAAYLAGAGLPAEGLVVNDGSGLSRYTAVSPRLIVALLARVAGAGCFRTFYEALGIAGDPGDIGFFADWGRGTAMAGNARIKSGSLGGVKAHSGYVTTRSGRMIAFSFVANNYSGAPEEVALVHQELILALAELP